MRAPTYLFIFCLVLIGCGQSDSSKDGATLQTTLSPSANALTAWDTTLVIGEAMVWRVSETEESIDWDSIEVTNVFGFKKAPSISSTVQVIPMTLELPILYLNVTETIPRDDFDRGSPQWYEVYLNNIQNSQYFEFDGPEQRRAEYPMDLLIVYPPMANCSYLDNESINEEDLPNDISSPMLKGALDFDGDGKPDAVIVEFCCDEPKYKNCDLTCGETYIKYQGEWYMVDSSRPA